MYNPHFLQVTQMCHDIAKAHPESLQTMKLTWLELKDVDGDVYQIVPLLDVVFKH